jgi:catalase
MRSYVFRKNGSSAAIGATQAALFRKGATTDMLARFSTVAGEMGSRSQKRLPDSGLRDNHMQWDFWTSNPESAHQVTYLMGERGLPRICA